MRSRAWPAGSADPSSGVAFVRADRDKEDALAAVACRRWDSVVDVVEAAGTGAPGDA
jgi:hypothetical protein